MTDRKEIFGLELPNPRISAQSAASAFPFGFDEYYFIEKLKQKHPSKPYNPDIANAFFRAGLIEAWGRGIQKIASECEIVGLPAPEYRYDFSGFILEFNLTSQNIPDETSEKILEAITSNNQITISELAETIGVTTRSIERNIKKLQQEDKLERIGSFKGGRWKIRGG